jgi:hypothetical protein
MPSNIFYRRQAVSVMVGSLWPTFPALAAGTLAAGTKNKDFCISSNTCSEKKVRVHLYSNTCMPDNIVYEHQAVSAMIGSLWSTLKSSQLGSISHVIIALIQREHDFCISMYSLRIKHCMGARRNSAYFVAYRWSVGTNPTGRDKK